MKKYLIYLLLFWTILYADNNIRDSNISEDKITKEKKIYIEDRIKRLLENNKKLDTDLNTNNIWFKVYSNYSTYKNLKNSEKKLEYDIRELGSKLVLTTEEEKRYKEYLNKQKTILGKLQLLNEYEKDPFKKLLQHQEIGEVPTIGNPIAVLNAISYKKQLNSNKEDYNSRYLSLENIVDKLEDEYIILNKVIALDNRTKEYQDKADDLKEKLDTFKGLLEIFKTTKNVYEKKIDEINIKLQREIKNEIEKTLFTLSIIAIFIIILFILKFIAHRYIEDDDRAYRVTKALNMTFFIIILFILLFSYIENVSYLVTILSFASAGIAIAMKDWFMSIMGWFVLLMGGSIKIGNRVKFVREGIAYVGDVVDISMLRMTIQEDITLTTYNVNRRAGRFIFVPNNFIFTDMIANYSHAGLKTVWDGIDFVITFDSDANRAMSIANEVTKKYSKGYTDITRKQLNKLRSEYSLKNTNVEPRIFAYIDTYGIKISSWYMTNSYATLKLRSIISMEIMDMIKADDSISMAYPSQSIYRDKNVREATCSRPPKDII
ncbi:MscS family mechanosensitive ion channel [hydrothermal vent metagenome]|uniref:MscS family mechanosensitive ion channel n=1 Tax=hydrothermal vent metagenome TaxID=652676 RepID=A0A1W1EI45_9ZZZZ